MAPALRRGLLLFRGLTLISIMERNTGNA